MLRNERLSPTAAKPAWPAESGDVDKEYVGGVPVASVKAASGSEGSGSSTGAQSLSNVPVLPPIRHTLSPIRDVSRETTQPNILLPSVSKGKLVVSSSGGLVFCCLRKNF